MMTYDEIIKNLKILIADDDEDYLLMTYSFLTQVGYSADRVTDGKQALEALKNKEYQILLLDYFMPELNGEEVVKEIRKTNQELIIILQTGFSGQKPPIETMQKLNIQNYHDKTEGIDRLNLELISAVKIFHQQNEIELTRYRTNAIGSLISGLAQEIKSNLFSVGAGLEATNMLINDSVDNIKKVDYDNMRKFYEKNKESLERIDKVLTSIISQSSDSREDIMTDSDIIDIIGLVLINDSKALDVKINPKVALKANSYIKGSINDTLFIICEILKKLMKLHDRGSSIDLILSEDESNWFFKIQSNKINDLGNTEILLLKKIIFSIKDTNLEISDTSLIITMKK